MTGRDRWTEEETSFVREFEACRLADFHHTDHVRLAWLYLRRYPLTDVLDRFRESLLRFATSRGKAEIYHQTVTWFYVLLIHQRMQQGDPEARWEEFVADNPDVLDWENPILRRFYRAETIDSELSRRIFVLPDRAEREGPR